MNNLLILSVPAILLLAVVLHDRHERQKLRQQRKSSQTLKRVRERHALRKNLHRIVRDEPEVVRRAKAEAVRLKLPQSSVEVLKATLVKAKEDYRKAFSIARESLSLL